MVDQKLIDCIMAHNKDFPDRNIDPDKEQYRRGFVMFHFIKDLQILLGTNPDGTLGPTDEIAFKKIQLYLLRNVYILKSFAGQCGAKVTEVVISTTIFMAILNLLKDLINSKLIQE